MKIAVWSTTPFAGRKSSNLLLLALQAIEEEGTEQLVIHTDPIGSGPEHFLLSGRHRSRMTEQKEFGLEFLCRLLRCERFSKEAVLNAAYTFAEGKLHVLPSGSSLFYEGDEEKRAEEICSTIRAAGEVFSHVWVELPAGESKLSEKVLGEVDCVIVNLGQSPCEREKLTGLPKFHNAFYLLGAYEQRTIYTVHNMMLMFPVLRGRCAVIPYHPGFFEACCAGEAEQFWRRGVTGTEDKAFSYLFREIGKTYKKWKEGSGTSICGSESNVLRTDRSF